MRSINSRFLYAAIFTFWVILWVNFLIRDLFVKGQIHDYAILAGSGSAGRRSHVYGEPFFGLLMLSKESLSEEASFKFAGVADMSIDHRRGIYYLYPRVEKEDPDYILVYGSEGFEKEGYDLCAALDKQRFVLKKRR
ncbi:MAG: hypothetical protein ABID09_00020 [Candidatus Omnitrophota bacterium]